MPGDDGCRVSGRIARECTLPKINATANRRRWVIAAAAAAVDLKRPRSASIARAGVCGWQFERNDYDGRPSVCVLCRVSDGFVVASCHHLTGTA